MKMETRDAVREGSPFTVREDGGERYIEGYFARFDDIYEMGYGVTESIDRHAFDEALANGDIRVLVNHDTTKVLGRSSSGTAVFSVTDIGLWCSCRINPADTDATNEAARCERGDVTGASFGFGWDYSKEAEYRKDGTIHVTLTKIPLHEVSVCTFPAYQKTAVGVREEDRAAASEENRAWREKQKERIRKWH